jgi:hypothetical protein
MTDHPINPPPELMEQWRDTWAQDKICCEMGDYIAVRAARWGADQELAACCLLLDSGEHAATYGCHDGSSLRAARRPKPPTLNNIALQMLGTIERDAHYMPEITSTIRRALETIPDEQNQRDISFGESLNK